MSQIIETKKMSTILNHIDDNTLVVFDVDNTLIEPKSLIGGVAWFKNTAKKFEIKLYYYYTR